MFLHASSHCLTKLHISRQLAGGEALAVGFDFGGGAAPFGVKGAGFDSPSDLLFPRSLLGLNQSEFYSLPSPRSAPNCSKASPSDVAPAFSAPDSAGGEALAVGFDFGGCRTLRF